MTGLIHLDIAPIRPRVLRGLRPTSSPKLIRHGKIVATKMRASATSDRREVANSQKEHRERMADANWCYA